jgi:hypothetical protein
MLAFGTVAKTRPPEPKAKRVKRDDGTVEFVFKLEGELRDMSVFELAPTLQSMGVALREANRALFPQSADLRVGVMPIEQGSYEIHYVLSYAKEHLPVIAMAAGAAPGGISQIAQLLGDLGVIKKAGAGVLDVINKLRGKPQKVEQIAPNQFKAESERGSVVVSGDVNELLQNSIVIENLNITIAAPANKPEVKDVQTYLADDPAATSITITKEIAGALVEYVKELNKPGDETKENFSTVWLNPHRGPFSGEPGSWWFTRGGGKPFTATIKDKGFLDSYGHGEPRLNSEDLLEVQLLEKQKISADGTLSTSYAILKVTDYRPAARKQRLPFPKSKRPRKR